MKKLLLISCFLLAATFIANAQTKEETISWLQEKLTKYLYYGVYSTQDKSENVSISVNECLITINFRRVEYENGVRGTSHEEYYKIPTDGLVIAHTLQNKNRVENIIEKYNDKEKLTSFANFHVTNGEENLLERLNKAVEHLAAFCPKKKETF